MTDPGSREEPPKGTGRLPGPPPGVKCYSPDVKMVSVRDLRQRWPETERALQREQEIIVMRDSVPVAKLVRYSPPKQPRARFDPARYARWQRRLSGGVATRWVDEGLLTERDER